MLVGTKLDRLTLLSLHRHRHHLVLEYARVPGLFGALLRREGHLIDFLPSQLVILAEALGGLGHGGAALRALESFPQAVLQRSGPAAQPPAPPPPPPPRLAHCTRP